MVFFITVLRALAACFITNAHYIGIYPTDLIANGGLIGDVLFFGVSGYCLSNVKMPFFRWYGKRIYRIYPPVLIMTLIYLILGAYNFTDHNAVWWFVYPTYYHFIASIIVLYIPFYFCMKINWLKNHIAIVMGVIAIIWMVVYLTVYDRSYYHIDNVREPIIRFLFMESMLLGAWFKQNDHSMRNKFQVWYLLATPGMFMIYFVSKLLFSRNIAMSQLQCLNQIAIFILLILMFMMFAGLDSKLERLSSVIKKVIGFISSVTLEIYVVQYVLIDIVKPIGHFPINWIVLTAIILGTAFILHKTCQLIYIGIDSIVKRLSGGNL